MSGASGLLERHLSFLEALRGAGLPVSLAEDLDAVAALGAVGWHDRATVRETYAATLVKRQGHRATFDTLFDLWFPRMVGGGVAERDREAEGREADAAPAGRDGGAALADLPIKSLKLQLLLYKYSVFGCLVENLT